MEYNTEVIKSVAEEIAEMFKRAVIAEQTKTGSLPGIAQIEAEMREAMRQIGQQSLSLLLSGMQTTPEIETRPLTLWRLVQSSPLCSEAYPVY